MKVIGIRTRGAVPGKNRARRKAEQLGVPFLGEVPLNIFLRETGDEGRMEQALMPGSPSRPYLLGVVEQLAAQISIQNIKTPKMPKLEVIEGIDATIPARGGR